MLIPKNTLRIERLPGDGSRWNRSIWHAVPPEPEGIPETYTLDAGIDGTEPGTLMPKAAFREGITRRTSLVTAAEFETLTDSMHRKANRNHPAETLHQARKQ